MKHFLALMILLATVCCPGCQGGGLPGLVPCHGVVTLDGNPIEGATVMLIPGNSDATLRNAIGVTDAAGKFRMTTLKENDGVMPGTYTVTVTKQEKSGEVIVLPEIDSETGERITFEPSVNRLPAVYENQMKSPLEITVPKGGVKTAAFELKSS